VRYFVLNKPPGCISARRDFAGRPTVYDHVPPHYPDLPHVGRLDFNTEGLLLFTDDGRLAQALLNPGFAGLADPSAVPPVEKVYHVKVRGELGDADPVLARLAEPMVILGAPPTRPAKVRVVAHRARATWVEVVIDEGRNRQVRRLCERAGLQIVKLRRVRLGPLWLGDLKLRWCRPLTATEVAACYTLALPADPAPPHEPIDDTPEAAARARARRLATPETDGSATVVDVPATHDAELEEE
jgi:23S rRNA pseudouridine2605 synthase